MHPFARFSSIRFSSSLSSPIRPSSRISILLRFSFSISSFFPWPSWFFSPLFSARPYEDPAQCTIPSFSSFSFSWRAFPLRQIPTKGCGSGFASSACASSLLCSIMQSKGKEKPPGSSGSWSSPLWGLRSTESRKEQGLFPGLFPASRRQSPQSETPILQLNI